MQCWLTHLARQIQIATHTDKNTPIYHLSITLTPKSGGAKPKNLSLSRSFTEWFDEKGHFVATPFQIMLASNVPTVGRLDPKRAQVIGAPTAGQENLTSTTAEDLDAMIAGDGAITAETTGSSAKKGGKKRKT